MRALRRLRAALSLVLRELRRDPRSGALVAALVALPSAAIMLVSVVLASQTPTAEERIAAELGSAEAKIWSIDPSGGAIVQSPVDPWEFAWTDETAGGGAPAVASLLPDGARVIEILTGASVLEAGESLARATVVAGEAWSPALAGPYEVLSGTAPQGPDEALVSPALAETLALEPGDIVTQPDTGRSVTVVGTMQWRNGGDAPAIFVPTGGMEVEQSATALDWYLTDTPLDWDQIQELNAVGYGAYSHAVAADPPADPLALATDGAVPGALLATGAVGILAVMLLAGAGFVVTFRSQQRERALVAVTGATRGTLVALGAARGLWLGLAGGVAGVALGLGLGFGWVAVLLHWDGASSTGSTWGYHVTWWHLLLVIGYGALAGAIASLIPALSASTLDAIAVLRGSRRGARARRWPALVGAALVVLGAAAMARAGGMLGRSLDLAGAAAYDLQSQAWFLLAGGAAVAFVGGTMLVAPALRALARMVAGWGVGARIAARDAARHVGRTAPVVAAVSLVIAIAAAMLLTLERDAAHDVDQWSPRTPMGDAVVRATSIDANPVAFAPAARAAIEDTLPGAEVTVIDTWREEISDPLDDAPRGVPYLLVPEENWCPNWTATGADRLTARESAADPRCGDLGGSVEISGAAIGDADTLAAILHTEPSQQAHETLAEGGVVVLLPTLLDGDTVTVGLFDHSAQNDPGSQEPPARSIVLPAAYQESEYLDWSLLAVISPEAAAEVGWPSEPTTLLVDAPEPITPAQQAQLDGAITAATGEAAWVDVEDGPSYGTAPGLAWVVVGIVAAFGIACTSIALGLARADARQDDLTLASLGASPTLARAVAAWQGALIVGVATTLGLALALGWVAVDSRSFVDYPFAPTWWLLGVAWVGAPATAGLLGWTFTRTPTTIHYRLAA